ncbi:MAG: DUF1361 domain-containing protein [Cyanobacteria bacterium J06642_2]
MASFLMAWIWNAVRLAGRHMPMMSWNLALAFVPLGLSCWLFQMSDGPRSARWWFWAAAFVLFLPNAPSVLTDIVYLIQAIRFTDDSVWLITLVLIPQFFIFISAGFFAYVFCLLNIGDYLRRYQMGRWILPMELGSHLLCAVGIFLGRFMRLRSWDAFSHPSRLLAQTTRALFEGWPLFVIGITFIVLVVLYALGKQAVLGWLREYPPVGSVS